MAMQFKWDLVAGYSATRTPDLTEIVRPCMVTGIAITDGATGTDPEVLLKVTDHTDCPVYGSNFPTTKALWVGCTLQEIRIRNRTNNTSAMVDFVYRRKTDHGDSGSAGSWVLNYSTTVSHITTYALSSGGLIKVWYKPGEASTTVSSGDPPSGGKGKSAAVHMMRVSGVLRCQALLTGTDWNSIKPTIKAARGKINSDTWGTDTRGKWFFIGPSTRTTDYGKSYTVTLDFLEADGDFFPFVIWRNRDGSHPKDSAPESAFSGLPSAAGQFARNAITKASIYKETAFSSLFAFTP